MIGSPPSLPSKDRAWLPVVRLALDLCGSRTIGPFKASNRQMNSAEAFLLAAFFYFVSLTFLGACMLPGLAIVPLGEFLAWPILVVAHILLLHAVVVGVGWGGKILQPFLGIAGVSRMAFQTTIHLCGLTALAVPMAFVGGFPAYTAWAWLAFCGINLMAAIFLLIK